MKEQILLSCPHTFPKSAGEKLLKYQENSLGDHILNSHDFWG